MTNKSLSKKIFRRRIINSITPRSILKLSHRKNISKKHWKNQKEGTNHGFEHYIQVSENWFPLLEIELEKHANFDSKILDLGCNCGAYINALNQKGYNNIYGIDISRNALEYGENKFSIPKNRLFCGSFEEKLIELKKENKSFDIIYTIGATLEVVHPSFDIIKSLSALCTQYILLIISESGHAYPRFWRYEFEKNGFNLIKLYKPFSDKKNYNKELLNHDMTVMVFMKSD